MSPERWDSLTIQDRAVFLGRLDNGILREARWRGLIERMSNSRFADLTPIQQDLVKRSHR